MERSAGLGRGPNRRKVVNALDVSELLAQRDRNRAERSAASDEPS